MPAKLNRYLISDREFMRLSGLALPELSGQMPRDRTVLVVWGSAMVAAFGSFSMASQLLQNPLLDITLGLVPVLAASGWLLGHQPDPQQGARPLVETAPAAWALYVEVGKFNRIVRSLIVSDQLQQVGNPGLPATVRQNLRQALRLVRQDLIRALKTERILRENQDVIDELLLGQADLFADNLASLRALQLESQAAEVGQSLTSAVQIALAVRERLQDWHSEAER
ncbi:MAG: hypothetical protein ACPGVO_02430 [Spirulinaceae cyanobacterium]